MKQILILAAFAALAACQTTVDPQHTTSTAGDVASYDAMRTAAQACNASGGHLELRRGSDPTMASNYICRPPEGGSR
jgi:hypothetical protein